jgi:hypothetical protein
MQLFRLVLVIAATLAVVGQYLQETRRLSVIRRMSGADGRRYYEATRERSERMLTVVTALLAVLAVGAVVYAFVLPR